MEIREKIKKKAYVFDAETEVTKSVTDATDIPSSVVKQSHNYRHTKKRKLEIEKEEIYWIWSKLPESEVEDERTERRDLNLRLTLPRFFRESNNEQGEEEEFCVEVTKEENEAATVASIDSYSGDCFLC